MDARRLLARSQQQASCDVLNFEIKRGEESNFRTRECEFHRETATQEIAWIYLLLRRIFYVLQVMPIFFNWV